jgi:uncharacterized membrane protein YphA (DoxX/SURF4 family)
VKLRNLPLRLSTGAYILNSGLDKRGLPEEAAAGMQGMAAGAFPQVSGLQPKEFLTLLSTSEVAIGAALLAPFVSPVVAGAALTGFSSALLTMYWRTPGMHKEGSVFPTADGIAIAKDAWMLGIGLSLILGTVTDKTAEVARTVSSATGDAVGSVTGSVTDAVGSVTGAVGSVTGSVTGLVSR